MNFGRVKCCSGLRAGAGDRRGNIGKSGRGPIRSGSLAALAFAFATHAALSDPPVDGGSMMASDAPMPATDGTRGLRVLRRGSRVPYLAIDLTPVADPESRLSAGGSVTMRIGFGRELPPAYREDLASHLTWGVRGIGDFVAVVQIGSPGARGMRAGVRAMSDKGVIMRFYDPEDASAPVHHHAPEPSGGRWENVNVHWSPTVDADRLGIEILAPTWSAARSLRLEIGRISHIHGASSIPRSLREALENDGVEKPEELARSTVGLSSNKMFVDRLDIPTVVRWILGAGNRRGETMHAGWNRLRSAGVPAWRRAVRVFVAPMDVRSAGSMATPPEIPAIPLKVRAFSDKSPRILAHPAAGVVLAVDPPETSDIGTGKWAGRTGPVRVGFGRRHPEAHQGNPTPRATWEIQRER